MTELGFALTEKGEVYSWGQGEFGALGNELLISLDLSGPPCLDEPAVQVSAGSFHFELVTMSGALYMCGSNMKG